MSLNRDPSLGWALFQSHFREDWAEWYVSNHFSIRVAPYSSRYTMVSVVVLSSMYSSILTKILLFNEFIDTIINMSVRHVSTLMILSGSNILERRYNLFDSG